jgi:hypothetical protein
MVICQKLSEQSEGKEVLRGVVHAEDEKLNGKVGYVKKSNIK